jgi:hypothetical protein
MRDIFTLFLHSIVTIIRLARPGAIALRISNGMCGKSINVLRRSGGFGGGVPRRRNDIANAQAPIELSLCHGISESDNPHL